MPRPWWFLPMAACSELRPPAPPPRQTDVPVEAMVHVQNFPDPAAAVRLLRSRGFEVTELDWGQVRAPVLVRGHFLQLRDVKDELEQLLQAPPPDLLPPNKGRSRHSGSGRGPDGPLPLLVDSDVFLYARRVMAGKLNTLMILHGASMSWKKEGEETTAVTVATPEVQRRLQVILQDLSRSLRVQDLRLGDLDQDMLGIIRMNGGVNGSVLVQFLGDRVRLVGPSEESWKLKQWLLGNPARALGLGPRRGPVQRFWGLVRKTFTLKKKKTQTFKKR
ncbi:uncharacterized protein LOC133461359 [Cololabis saira]|uniref:uncharacterized protein LOC133461359 n=1 Tax=Cololabis saira TaxID=129043 RepID=UPI002AD54699|nr:uncharacterized protein LOC133461359 [Cololabis saira]